MISLQKNVNSSRNSVEYHTIGSTELFKVQTSSSVDCVGLSVAVHYRKIPATSDSRLPPATAARITLDMPHKNGSPTNLQYRTKPLKSALRRTQQKFVHHDGLTEDEHQHHHPVSESEAGPELDGSSESVSDESAGDAQGNEDDDDVDAPRVVQWADVVDENREGLSEEETDDEDTNAIPGKPSRDLVRSHFAFVLCRLTDCAYYSEAVSRGWCVRVPFHIYKYLHSSMCN